MMLGATALSTRCCKCSPLLMCGSQSDFNARSSECNSSTQSTSCPQQSATSDGKNTLSDQGLRVFAGAVAVMVVKNYYPFL